MAYGNGLNIDHFNEAHPADGILCIWFAIDPGIISMICPPLVVGPEEEGVDEMINRIENKIPVFYLSSFCLSTISSSLLLLFH